MLNQFLMNWDGLTSGTDSPFILLATNRPFGLDPAVLRRSPVRNQIDLPTQWEKEQILKPLLEGDVGGGFRDDLQGTRTSIPART